MMTGQFVVLEYVAPLVALIVFSPSVYYHPCLFVELDGVYRSLYANERVMTGVLD